MVRWGRSYSLTAAWEEVGPFAMAVELADVDVIELRVDERLWDLDFDWSAKI